MQTVTRTLADIRRRYLFGGGVAILVLVGLGLGLGFGLNSGNSKASQPPVELGVGGKGIVATGSLSDMVAKASTMTGLQIVIPELPDDAYVKGIGLVPGPDGSLKVKTGPTVNIDIRVPSGQYMLTEFAGGLSGAQSAAGATEVKSLERPGETVWRIDQANVVQYQVSGKKRSYTLIAGRSDAVVASARIDFPKMVASMPVD